MKKFFYIIFFFTILSNANADLKIVYIDINEILTNSKVGKSITEYMTSLEIKVNIQIFSGNKEFEVYTMDLTKKYIEINADYRS